MFQVSTISLIAVEFCNFVFPNLFLKKNGGFIYCLYYLMLCSCFIAVIHLIKGKAVCVLATMVYGGSNGRTPLISNLCAGWGDTGVVLYAPSPISYHKEQNIDTRYKFIK